MTEVKLILGDCLDVLRELEPGSVDAILTDLPYGTTACAWDTVIPFAPMWEAVRHVLKPRGVFVTTASQPFTSALVMSNPKWFRYEWILDKRIPSNFANVKYQPLKYHENILAFSQCSHIYNPQYRVDVKKPFGRMVRDNKSEHIQDLSHTGVAGVGYPKSILEFTRPNNLTGGGLHPTQKPVALYEYLIRTYTNAGDTVLDFCAGSGTTGVACVQTGRNFIGIEIDPHYFEIGKARIAQAQAQPPLIPHEAHAQPVQNGLLEDAVLP